jgi:hypothetical protein
MRIRMSLEVNLSYMANYSLHGVYSPLYRDNRAPLFYMPILMKRWGETSS